MMQIAVQDANILIDLVNAGLFDHCLALQYQFTTTNIILAELYEQQVALVQPHINSGKFIIIEITPDELRAIQTMSLADTHLSEQDWSAYYYAKRDAALLLTGDKRLRRIATTDGITVCGIFWIIDQLVELNILSATDACIFLRQLMATNKRLPADESTKRIKMWCSK